MAPLWMVTPATVFDVVVFHAIAVEKSRWIMAPLFTTVPLALPASLDKMSLSRHPRALTGEHWLRTPPWDRDGHGPGGLSIADRARRRIWSE